jgi:DNA-directed RNA polymerase subunit RPC12/RpoP
MENKTIQNKKLKCPHCNYVWVTKSQRLYPTCPNCTYKVNAEKNLMATIENMIHFNLDENGVRIQDPSLATKYSPHGRIIDIYFKKGKIHCDYCDSSDCKHIRYALTLPIVVDILKKKGWKLS